MTKNIPCDQNESILIYHLPIRFIFINLEDNLQTALLRHLHEPLFYNWLKSFLSSKGFSASEGNSVFVFFRQNFKFLSDQSFFLVKLFRNRMFETFWASRCDGGSLGRCNVLRFNKFWLDANMGNKTKPPFR